MSEKTQALRRLLQGEELVVAASTHTVLAARINERAGFKVLYSGGYALGALHYGIPDYGVLEQREMITQTARIANSVQIPLIVDADEIGGNAASIYRWIPEYIDHGIAGLHLEDEQEPKHSTYRGDLLSIEDMQARIALAVQARTDPDFVLIVRSNELINREAFGEGSLDEAIRRGQAYAEAGADSYVVPSIEPDEVGQLARALPIPVTAFGLKVDGVRLTLTGFGSLDGVYEHWARTLKETGTLPPEAFDRADGLYDLLDEGRFDRIVRDWALRTGRPTGPSLHEAQA